MTNEDEEVTSEQQKLAYEFFSEEFGEPAAGQKIVTMHAPGRSEIAGNHTDHEGGHVIAGALNVSVDGIAVPNNTMHVRMASKGYPRLDISLEDLSPVAEEKVTTAALIRGMASCMAKDGRTPSGFDMAITCDIPVGGGLSSSAAIEAAIGRTMETLWPGRSYTPLEMAKMSQYAENDYFGKPCGLMDQASVCLGGLAFIDFGDPQSPKAQKLNLDFETLGYGLCLVDVGCDHAHFTDEYAAMPIEMQAVAAQFGKKRLSEVKRNDFDAHVVELRKKLGDRALLRAIHYWRENELVDKRWDALNSSDIDHFLEETRESGASSAMFLQNVSSGGRYQPAMLALGLAEHALDGKGASRIHGGGFGGTIQCFVPLEIVDDFSRRMNAWLGEGSCQRYRITEKGAYAQWL
jgi:galactokinase